jgi:hypothetical protein
VELAQLEILVARVLLELLGQLVKAVSKVELVLLVIKVSKVELVL